MAHQSQPSYRSEVIVKLPNNEWTHREESDHSNCNNRINASNQSGVYVKGPKPPRIDSTLRVSHFHSWAHGFRILIQRGAFLATLMAS
jgi:hypothetical protein